VDRSAVGRSSSLSDSTRAEAPLLWLRLGSSVCDVEVELLAPTGLLYRLGRSGEGWYDRLCDMVWGEATGGGSVLMDSDPILNAGFSYAGELDEMAGGGAERVGMEEILASCSRCNLCCSKR
jgi:hypothetical protein